LPDNWCYVVGGSRIVRGRRPIRARKGPLVVRRPGIKGGWHPVGGRYASGQGELPLAPSVYRAPCGGPATVRSG
jgi:hypothetical protein